MKDNKILWAIGIIILAVVLFKYSSQFTIGGSINDSNYPNQSSFTISGYHLIAKTNQEFGNFYKEFPTGAMCSGNPEAVTGTYINDISGFSSAHLSKSIGTANAAQCSHYSVGATISTIPDISDIVYTTDLDFNPREQNLKILFTQSKTQSGQGCGQAGCSFPIVNQEIYLFNQTNLIRLYSNILNPEITTGVINVYNNLGNILIDLNGQRIPVYLSGKYELILRNEIIGGSLVPIGGGNDAPWVVHSYFNIHELNITSKEQPINQTIINIYNQTYVVNQTIYYNMTYNQTINQTYIYNNITQVPIEQTFIEQYGFTGIVAIILGIVIIYLSVQGRRK